MQNNFTVLIEVYQAAWKMHPNISGNLEPRNFVFFKYISANLNAAETSLNIPPI